MSRILRKPKKGAVQGLLPIGIPEGVPVEYQLEETETSSYLEGTGADKEADAGSDASTTGPNAQVISNYEESNNLSRNIISSQAKANEGVSPARTS